MDSVYSRESIARIRQDQEFTAVLCGHSLRFCTTWGLFSPRGIDEGTQMLLQYANVRPSDIVLDIGCGYGALGLPLAAQATSGSATLVDKDFVAVEYCQKNARANGLDNVEVLLSNGLAQVGDRQFDVVVSNLPAKSGKELYYIMFHDAWAHMVVGGHFYIVTITGLRRFIKRAFTDVFGNYSKLKQGPTYTVAMAKKDA
jgi:16S rRNA G1207 methylase RsmC